MFIDIKLGSGKMVKEQDQILLHIGDIKEDITNILENSEIVNFFENEKSPVTVFIEAIIKREKNIEKIAGINLIYGTPELPLNIFSLNIALLTETFWNEVWKWNTSKMYEVL